MVKCVKLLFNSICMFNKAINKNSVKVPKVIKPTKTLGTSILTTRFILYCIVLALLLVNSIFLTYKLDFRKQLFKSLHIFNCCRFPPIAYGLLIYLKTFFISREATQ